MTISNEFMEAYLLLTSKLTFALLNPLNTWNMKLPVKQSYIDSTRKLIGNCQPYYPVVCDIIDKMQSQNQKII